MKGTAPALDNGMRGYTITVVRAIRRQYNIITVQPGDDIVRYEKHTGHDPYSEKRLSYWSNNKPMRNKNMEYCTLLRNWTAVVKEHRPWAVKQRQRCRTVYEHLLNRCLSKNIGLERSRRDRGTEQFINAFGVAWFPSQGWHVLFRWGRAGRQPGIPRLFIRRDRDVSATPSCGQNKPSLT